ncbi:MAG: RnfH family protein [Gammaproteobacteria bacterium]|nr:RnfH family protein [Gammaproteobacteria bacterium]MBI5614876.1 RnfH family protein [Gammaproteobacteria bacterium]
MADSLAVEVVYALPDQQYVVALDVPPGTTLRGAIERSRILETCPEIDLAVNGIGVFGRRRAPEDLVAEGERVEIYRPLLVDPKEARRRRGRRPQ